MSFCLELRQNSVSTVQVNGTILPRHSNITIYDRPRIQAMLNSSSASEVLHILPITDIDWVFVLNSVYLSMLLPRYYANDWPPNPVGQKHLRKTGVHVLVSSDQRGIVFVNDKSGQHQLDKYSPAYLFEEGSLRVAER